jgi:hypothetical protein
VNQRRDTVQAILPGGAEISVSAVSVGGAEDVAAPKAFDLEGVREALTGMAQLAHDALSKVSPDSATVEFGLDVKVESGKLTGLLVSGSGEASLKVTLEWSGKRD